MVHKSALWTTTKLDLDIRAKVKYTVGSFYINKGEIWAKTQLDLTPFDQG